MPPKETSFVATSPTTTSWVTTAPQLMIAPLSNFRAHLDDRALEDDGSRAYKGRLGNGSRRVGDRSHPAPKTHNQLEALCSDLVVPDPKPYRRPRPNQDQSPAPSAHQRS